MIRIFDRNKFYIFKKELATLHFKKELDWMDSIDDYIVIPKSNYVGEVTLYKEIIYVPPECCEYLKTNYDKGEFN